MKKLLLSVLGCAAFAGGAYAQIPLDYYASLDGLSGAELKAAIFEVVNRDVKMLEYGSKEYKTWWGFYYTDRTADDKVRDRYSPMEFEFGERGASVAGMNIEHSFPKSWWGGSQSVNSYKDLYNLMPCQSTINNHKSNYPMANVDTEWRGNGVTKVGPRNGEPQDNDYYYWEPGDQWKGDFARDYFYMATAYSNLTWSGDQAVRILNQEDYPTLKPWAYELYLQWAAADEVDAIETDRNNMVERFQGNRNPYVDFPNLSAYVWGDSIGVPFNPLTSVKSQEFIGGVLLREKDSEHTDIFSATFLGDGAGCVAETAPSSAAGITVWNNTTSYGWQASGAKGAADGITNYATDATLLTPEIDLTDKRAAWFSFEHAVNYATAPYDCLSVEIRADGISTPVHVRRWPLGNKWDFFNTSEIDLTPWAGKKVRIAFHYTSSAAEAPTWEVKNLKVAGVNSQAGVGITVADEQTAQDATPQYFTIDGRRISDPSAVTGIVIEKRGSSVSKMLVK